MCKPLRTARAQYALRVRTGDGGDDDDEGSPRVLPAAVVLGASKGSQRPVDSPAPAIRDGVK